MNDADNKLENQLIDYLNEEIFHNRLKNPIKMEDDLLGSGLVDSMGLMRFIGFIEKILDIKIPPQDLVLENFTSVSAIVSYLQQRDITK